MLSDQFRKTLSGSLISGEEIYKVLCALDNSLNRTSAKQEDLFFNLKKEYAKFCTDISLLDEYIKKSFFIYDGSLIATNIQYLNALVFLLESSNLYQNSSSKLNFVLAFFLSIAAIGGLEVAMLKLSQYSNIVDDKYIKGEKSLILPERINLQEISVTNEFYQEVFKEVLRIDNLIKTHGDNKEVLANEIFQINPSDLLCLDIIEKKYGHLKSKFSLYLLPGFVKQTIEDCYCYLQKLHRIKKLGQIDFDSTLDGFVTKKNRIISRKNSASMNLAYQDIAEKKLYDITKLERSLKLLRKDAQEMAEWDKDFDSSILKKIDAELRSLFSFQLQIISDRDKYLKGKDKFEALVEDLRRELSAYKFHNPDGRTQSVRDVEEMMKSLEESLNKAYSWRFEYLLNFLGMKKDEAQKDHYAGYIGRFKYKDSKFARMCNSIIEKYQGYEPAATMSLKL